MENTKLNEQEARALAQKTGKGIKTEADLADLTKMMRKVVIETAFDVEMDKHPGYEKHAAEGNGSGNSRNGKSRKTLKGDHGELELEIPRDSIQHRIRHWKEGADYHINSNRTS